MMDLTALGHDLSGWASYPTDSVTTGTRGTDYYANPDLTAGFHTYGVDWQSDHVTWYLDGKALFSVTDPAAVPQERQYVL